MLPTHESERCRTAADVAVCTELASHVWALGSHPASNPDTMNTETSKSEVQGAPRQWSESEAGLA